MLLPALNTAREKARRISCTSNLKQIGLAAKMYSGDFNEKFPCSKDYYQGKDSTWVTGSKGYHNGPSMSLLLSHNYNVDYKTYVCPSGALNGIQLSENSVGVTVDTSNFVLDVEEGSVSKTNLSYAFIAGMTENDSPDSGLTFDCGYEAASKKTNHEKYGNICFVDGSTRNFAGDNWAANIAFYGTKDTTSTFPAMSGGATSAPGVFKHSTDNTKDTPTNGNGKICN